MANDLGQYRVGREGKNVMFLPPPKVPEGTFLLGEFKLQVHHVPLTRTLH
jgi:hypothetical protein